jgi:DNA-binding response OmpR family regulator
MLRDSRPRHGCKVLVVEDDYLLAEIICDFLRDRGMQPVGPAGQLHEDGQLAKERAIDAAVLDVKLHEDLCFPICMILNARRIPFVFVTGSPASLIPLEFRGEPLVRKPFQQHELRDALALILKSSRGRLWIEPKEPIP